MFGARVFCVRVFGVCACVWVHLLVEATTNRFQLLFNLLNPLAPPPGIQARARLFFNQLSKSGTGSARGSASAAAGASAANPVYNLLPDMLSALCREKVGYCLGGLGG